MRAPLFAGLFAIGLVTTTIMTRDFFYVDTRARWAVIEQAISDYKLAAGDIDGGFEYNNYVFLRCPIA